MTFCKWHTCAWRTSYSQHYLTHPSVSAYRHVPKGRLMFLNRKLIRIYKDRWLQAHPLLWNAHEIIMHFGCDKDAKEEVKDTRTIITKGRGVAVPALVVQVPPVTLTETLSDAPRLMWEGQRNQLIRTVLWNEIRHVCGWCDIGTEMKGRARKNICWMEFGRDIVWWNFEVLRDRWREGICRTTEGVLSERLWSGTASFG
jgi:hypothetical protein